MSKSGTTASTAAKSKTASTSGVRHGQNVKNLSSGASPRPKPTSGGRTAPIKGPNRGGV